jgi:hypothetical protein
MIFDNRRTQGRLNVVTSCSENEFEATKAETDQRISQLFQEISQETAFEYMTITTENIKMNCENVN